MIRPVRSLRHAVRALVMLFVLASLAEIVLRYDDFRDERTLDAGKVSSKLIAECWSTHHRMKPFQSLLLRHADTETPTEFLTNSYGLRGREPAVPKPPEALRVICLGGATTLGVGTEESETFCTRLQRYLQDALRLRVDVINAGVPEYSPLLSYLQLKHDLSGLQPDLIVLNFDMADVARDYRYRRHTIVGSGDVPLACPGPTLEESSGQRGGWFADRFLIIQECKHRLGGVWREGVRPRDDTSIGCTQGCYAWITNDPPDWSVHIQQTLSVLDQLNTLATGIGAQMILATYPAPWQVSPSASDGGDVRQRVGVPQDALYASNVPFEILADYANERAITFCDASSTFRTAPKPERLYQKQTPHFSSLGHELYARELAKHLTSHWQARRMPPGGSLQRFGNTTQGLSQPTGLGTETRMLARPTAHLKGTERTALTRF